MPGLLLELAGGWERKSRCRSSRRTTWPLVRESGSLRLSRRGAARSRSHSTHGKVSSAAFQRWDRNDIRRRSSGGNVNGAAREGSQDASSRPTGVAGLARGGRVTAEGRASAARTSPAWPGSGRRSGGRIRGASPLWCPLTSRVTSMTWSTSSTSLGYRTERVLSDTFGDVDYTPKPTSHKAT